MSICRNEREKANQTLDKARAQIATYESFMSHYRQSYDNGTSRDITGTLFGPSLIYQIRILPGIIFSIGLVQANNLLPSTAI
jgi:hypothetical protein